MTKQELIDSYPKYEFEPYNISFLEFAGTILFVFLLPILVTVIYKRCFKGERSVEIFVMTLILSAIASAIPSQLYESSNRGIYENQVNYWHIDKFYGEYIPALEYERLNVVRSTDKNGKRKTTLESPRGSFSTKIVLDVKPTNERQAYAVGKWVDSMPEIKINSGYRSVTLYLPE